MSVTGHKSVQSLSVYQRVETEEKIKMGQTITNSIVPSAQLSLPTTSRPALQNVPVNMVNNNTTDLVPAATNDHLTGIDLTDLFSDFSATSNPGSSRIQQMPAFFGCTIQNLHLNHKTLAQYIQF